MRYLERAIDQSLLTWKQDASRKPLLLRGARQTGKTTAIRHFAKSFEHFVEVNFEHDRGVQEFFDGELDVRAICAKLEMRYNTPILPGRTLVFLDEIQSCPNAISALRYFYEDYPELHVVASGSLLEFAFANLSDFGVGRIRNLFIYPISFEEFTWATDNALLHAGMLEASFERPLPSSLHDRLLALLRDFLIVGGMPAVVRKYVETRSFLACQQEQDDILVSLKSDFDKYHRRVPPEQIRDTLLAVEHQLGSKFVYSNTQLGLKTQQTKQCLALLEMAKLVHRVSMSYGNGLPLGGEINSKMNKYLPLDTGLYLRDSGLDLSEWIQDSPAQFVNRGKLGELFVGLELLKASGATLAGELYYWQREARGANAKVDYLSQRGNEVLPIEAKSGTRGSMQSLWIFLEEKKLSLGVRTSQENFARHGKICVLPLYAIGQYRHFLKSDVRTQ
ncbi:MAG: ATP-binding protein [Victivallales bacterium]|nr:ATP-binding protein [Victivallales bacterium]